MIHTREDRREKTANETRKPRGEGKTAKVERRTVRKARRKKGKEEETKTTNQTHHGEEHSSERMYTVRRGGHKFQRQTTVSTTAISIKGGLCLWKLVKREAPGVLLKRSAISSFFGIWPRSTGILCPRTRNVNSCKKAQNKQTVLLSKRDQVRKTYQFGMSSCCMKACSSVARAGSVSGEGAKYR